ncbi:hypothetical protein BH23PSE1_BH23PSE1_09440 [soil metagenome]
MTPLAAIFPRAVGGVLIGLCLLQVVMSLAGRSGRTLEQGGTLAEQVDGLGRRLTLVATMLAWAAVFPYLGFVVTGLAASLVLTATGQFGRLTPLRSAAYLVCLVAMVGAFYLLMVNVLHIPMPRGLLF